MKTARKGKNTFSSGKQDARTDVFRGAFMIEKFSYGKPFDTGTAVVEVKKSAEKIPFGTVSGGKQFKWEYDLKPGDTVYGLGETMKGINIRGGKFVSWCLDQPNQDETTESLYGAHNFILVFGKETFGVYFDYPGEMEFDIGFTFRDKLTVTAEKKSLNIFVITPEKKSQSLKNIVSQFRELTGRNYIPPKWAFGFMQSRWGYKCKKDIDEVIKKHRELSLPLDSVCLDIDYMEQYKDFTVDEKKFPGFGKYTRELLKNGIRLVPIIDAGVKKEDGYDICDEGKKHFCVDKNGNPFIAGVWPGDSYFPDFLNEDARKFFGSKYKRLTDHGIEGFWNDMNEPAMFYSKTSLEKTFSELEKYKGRQLDVKTFFEFTPLSTYSFNRKDDTELFFHKVPAKTAGDFAATEPDSDGNVLVSNRSVHNLFGYNMTKAAQESFLSENPDKRRLLFSRSSFVGSHRYGGIWTGDNHSYWSNILLSLHMMASLNMTGFLYTGSDTGGFNADASRDLMLRWTAFSVFTPLFRNHTADGTRRQEYYQFEDVQDFKSMLDLRYALIPYLYSEFMKASLTNGMYFRPLSFDYQNDVRAVATEDQIMLGDALMVAPVYVQNALGRHVYLPEDMCIVEWKHSKIASEKTLPKGDHFITVPLESVVFFIKKNKIVPLAKPALNTDSIDTKKMTVAGDAPKGTVYELYEDDGFTTEISLEKSVRKITK